MDKENNWEESLNIDVRFSWATEEQKKHILVELRFQRETAKQEEKERIILAIRKTLVVEGVLSLSVEKALAELKALNPTKQ